MFFRMIYDEHLAQAAYLIGCQRTGEAIIIDPQRDIDRYLDLASANNLRIVAAAETHIHADFLSGVREVADRIGARVYVSGEGGEDWQSRWLGAKLAGGSYDHNVLHDGDTFNIGNIRFDVLHTPGHTPEHISYMVTDLGGGADEAMGIVTGDFVFVGDLGRPDLLETAAGIAGVKEAAARELFASANLFLNLPDHLQVWPAHGAGSACGKALGAVPQSTIGYERRFSPALTKANDERAFVSYILEGQPEPPMYFSRMKRLNRDGVPVLGSPPKPRELGKSELGSIGTTLQIVDTRSWSSFRDGHLPGSLWSPLGAGFHTSAGAYLDPERNVALVVDREYVEQGVRELIRIGFDRIVAFTTPETMERFGSDGGALAQIPETNAADVAGQAEGVGGILLDVRRAVEYRQSHIPGATNAAHTRLVERLDTLPRDREIFVYCRSGVRSGYACALLHQRGFSATNVAGGYEAWATSGHVSG